MDRKDSVTVFYGDEAIQPRAIEERLAQSGAAFVDREAPGQNHSDAAAGTQQAQRPLEKQLIQVRVASALERIHARSPGERAETAARIACRLALAGSATIPAKHLPGRIPDDGIKSCVLPGRPIIPIEDLWKLQRPMEEPFPARDVPGFRNERGRGPGRKRGEPSEDFIRERV